MGHPDKIADRIADAILDYMLRHDPHARVACETLLSGDHIAVAGEISSRRPLRHPQIDQLVRDTVRSIGYTDPTVGLDADAADVHVFVQRQSPDIARAVNGDGDGELGAGDQGMMFGYATRQTDELMPLPIQLAHRLVGFQAQARERDRIPDLRPDAKAQVTVEFKGRVPVAVHSVILSTQHGPGWNDKQGELREAVIDKILVPALGRWWHDDLTVTSTRPASSRSAGLKATPGSPAARSSWTPTEDGPATGVEPSRERILPRSTAPARTRHATWPRI